MDKKDGIERLAWKMAVKNAMLHGGRANKGAVINYMLGHDPSLRERIRDILPVVERVVAEVNGLPPATLEELADEYGISGEEKTQELSLPNPGERPVLRFPPEPNGYLHLGHAKAAYLGYYLARKHNGTFIVRFDDTNPRKERAEFYDAIRYDLEWLGIEPDIWKNTSDDMDRIHEEGRRLIEKGKAYVCTCPQDKIREGRRKGVECGCRGRGIGENLELWEGMFSDIPEGGAIVRYMGNMQSANTVMRDPTLFRIMDAFHPLLLDSNRVWPTYDFAVVVEDHIDGITHMMRSKEYELRDELYRALMKDLGYTIPEIIEFSRLQVRGFVLSKRKINKLLEEGVLVGWDDPRLLTISGLRRRGIVAQAIREFVLSLGLSKAEGVVEFRALESYNRKAVDPTSPRYFFVPDPVEVEIDGELPEEVEIRKHPSEDLGTRRVKVCRRLFLPKEDWESVKEGETIRLKDLANIRKVSGRKAEVVDDESLEYRKIQWVCKWAGCRAIIPGEMMDGDKVVNPELKQVFGYAEESVMGEEAGRIIQFERFGFCRIDKKMDDGLIVIRAHK